MHWLCALAVGAGEVAQVPGEEAGGLGAGGGGGGCGCMDVY